MHPDIRPCIGPYHCLEHLIPEKHQRVRVMGKYSGFRVQRLGFRVWGSGFRVQGL